MIFCLILFTAIFLLLAKAIRHFTRISKLHERHIFITGCDSGFGRQLAIRLDKKGIPVFAGCLLEKSIEELHQCCSSRLKAVQIDVTCTESVRLAKEFVKKELGNKNLWALVNNAGISGAIGSFEWLTKEDCLKVLEVNLLGVYDVTLTFLPLIRRAKEGRVVNIASVLGRISFSPSPYIISKYAVEGFSDGLSYELAHFNVTVHTLEPGFFKTNLTDVELNNRSIERSWRQASPEIQTDYGGEAYFQKAKAYSNKMLKDFSSPRTELVVDAYEHALTAKYPHNRYHVGSDAKYFFIPLSFLPIKLQMFIFNGIQCLMGLKRPQPGGVENSRN